MNYKINDDIFTAFPKLETERLFLTEFMLSDSEELFKMRSDKKILKYLDREPHKSIEESELMISEMIKTYKNKDGINWIIKKKDSLNVIGYIGYLRMRIGDVRAEIGYAMKPEYWGNGFMSEAMAKVIDFGFKVFCLHSIEANVNPANLSSIKLLEKFGFKREAFFHEDYFFNGKFFDSAIYSLLETEI
ncbi:MAG: GNAT family N-acetyltransferase [Ignavibacteriales bacterium]|nr:GNAT family N-acetyltransferase [Ignavibacteriales bacterium]